MSQIDFTNLTNFLNKDILPSVKTQTYEEAPMWQIFGGFKAEKDSGEIEELRVNPASVSFHNNTLYFTIKTGRMAGTSMAPGEKFPYGTLASAQGSLGIATPVVAFEVPKQVLKMKNEGEILDTIQFSMDEQVSSMAHDLNRQAYGDGTATLAYASGSGTSTTTLNLKPKAAASTFYNNDIPLAESFFPVGTYIKVGSNTVTTVAAQLGDNQIQTTDAITFANNDAIVKNTASLTTATEFTGLASIVSTSDYANIAVATNPSWSAQVDTNSGVARTMATAYNTTLESKYIAAQKFRGVEFIIMNATEFQKYGDQLVTYKKTKDLKEVLSGGWKGLEFMGGMCHVFLDYECPDDRAYIISPQDLYRGELQGLEFEPGNGGNLGQRITQQLDQEIVCDTMGNFLADRRRGQGVLTNLVG